MGLTCKSYSYLKKSLWDRKKRESVIPIEDITEAIEQIIKYPGIGGVKGSLTLLLKQAALIGSTFYTEIKNKLRELAETEITKRKEESELKKNQINRKEKEKWFNKVEEDKPNKVWAIDFVYLQFLGITFYLCLVYDVGTQTYLAIEAGEDISNELAKKAIESALRLAGRKPDRFLLSDNGVQFICVNFQDYLEFLRIKDKQTPKGKPWFNGSLESGNKEVRKILYTVAIYKACENTAVTIAGTARSEILNFLIECCRETQRILNEEIARSKFKTTPIIAFNKKVDKTLNEIDKFKQHKIQERKKRMEKIKSAKNQNAKTFEKKIKIAWNKIVTGLSFEKLYAFNELINNRYEIVK